MTVPLQELAEDSRPRSSLRPGRTASAQLVVGSAGGHRGRVYFWVHDEGPDPAAWDGEVETAGNVQLLADSFTAFVAGLRPPDGQ